MNVVTGLASMMAVGVAVVIATVWLGRRRSQISRLLSVLIGSTTGLLCGFAAFALIADNVGMALKPAGVAATVAFALTSVAAVMAVVHSVRRGAAAR